MTKFDELAGIMADTVAGGVAWADPRNNEEWRNFYRAAVTKLLKAMWEPSEEMVLTLADSSLRNRREGIAIWQGMLRQLLSESPEQG